MQIQAAHEKELYSILINADGIILTVDESSDNVTERSVLNMVLTPITAAEAKDEQVSYIGDQLFIENFVLQRMHCFALLQL